MPDRVTRELVGHIFAGVTRAGGVDCFAIAETIAPSPLRREIQMPQSMRQRSQIKLGSDTGIRTRISDLERVAS